MKIRKPIENPTSEIQKEFNAWFKEKQEKEGLKYVSISLQEEFDYIFRKRKPLKAYLPKFIKRHLAKRYLDKVLKQFMYINKGLDDGSIETRPFVDY